MGEKLEKVYPYGPVDRGRPFHEHWVKEIGLRGQDWIDAIYLDGNKYGGSGGQDTPRLVMAADEFISSMDIRVDSRPWAARISYLRFTTNKGRQIASGSTVGELYSYPDIKLLAIAGRAQDWLDRIEIRMLIDSAIYPEPGW